MTAPVGLARLSLTRGLFSAANAAITVVSGYAVFVIDDSAFMTGLVDGAYTLAFAAATTWLTFRGRTLSDRASIAAGGFLSAAVLTMVVRFGGVTEYVWLLLLTVMVGAATGATYPAWYSQFRRGRDGEKLHARIGSFEALRVVAVLCGALGGGLGADRMGVGPTLLFSAAMFAAAGMLALTFPCLDSHATHGPRSRHNAASSVRLEMRRRIRLLFGLLAAVQFLLAPIVAVTPVLGVEEIDGGVASVGILSTLYGAGSVLQIITSKAAARGSATHTIVSACLGVMMMSAILAAAVDDLASSGVLMVSFGFGAASIATLINAEIQSSVPEIERDKLMATFALVLSVPLALGSAGWGLAADFVSVPIIAIVASALTAVIALLLLVAGHRRSSQWGKPV